MEINVWAVVAAVVAQFVIGMLWYTAIFGKAWGQMHGFDKLSPEKQKEMAAKMGPWYGMQLVGTVLTSLVLAMALDLVPEYSAYAVAFWVWLGFVLPFQFSDIAFGGTESQWFLKKFMISVLGSLACLLVGAAVLQAF